MWFFSLYFVTFFFHVIDLFLSQILSRAVHVCLFLPRFVHRIHLFFTCSGCVLFFYFIFYKSKFFFLFLHVDFIGSTCLFYFFIHFINFSSPHYLFHVHDLEQKKTPHKWFIYFSMFVGFFFLNFHIFPF